MDFALGVAQSLGGQSWYWRAHDARDTAAMAQRFGIPEIIARVLSARGATSQTAEGVLSPTLREALPDPSIFCDMDKAVARLVQAITNQESIVIFGDYDVDGGTSAALLLRYLRALDVVASAYIPDRFLEGYGPNENNMRAIAASGATLIITVDCGTQAYAALQVARDAGADVIVVDHHKASTQLPVAAAIINPNRFDETEGAVYGNLAAVGVAFLFAVALNRDLRRGGYFANRAEPDVRQLLDLVALGTVCDVVPLTGLNRAFVTQGLKVLAGRGNLGLAMLSDVSGIEESPDAGALGFHLGPRINAGGRVGKSDLGVRLLTTESESEARDLAAQLDALNAERKTLEAMVTEHALAAAESLPDPVLTVWGDNWHAGVIGIAAGRMKERFNKPCLVIGIENGIAKGSGRSVTGVDLGAAILAAKEEGLLVAGGGHAMAAGLTAEPEKLPALRAFLNDQLERAVVAAQARQGLFLDGVLAPRGLTAELVEAIERAGPYGAGWPAPRLACGPFSVIKADVVGQNHVRLILAGSDGGRVKAIAFRQADQPLGAALLNAGNRQFHVAGRLVLNSWGGRSSAEMHVEDAALVS
jgi:single-stranded-DNA-specific exonuclease